MQAAAARLEAGPQELIGAGGNVAPPGRTLGCAHVKFSQGLEGGEDVCDGVEEASILAMADAGNDTEGGDGSGVSDDDSASDSTYPRAKEASSDDADGHSAAEASSLLSMLPCGVLANVATSAAVAMGPGRLSTTGTAAASVSVLMTLSTATPQAQVLGRHSGIICRRAGSSGTLGSGGGGLLRIRCLQQLLQRANGKH